jgi:hypothetical protein
MATKTIKVSDLTGTEIGSEENLAHIVVEEHPGLTESVTLEVLPEEVEGKLPEEQNYVRLTYYPPTDSREVPRSLVLPVEEFNALSRADDMGEVLQNALAEQHEREGRRRGRRGRWAAGERRPRKDYTSPEHAGEPHRGRVTDAEKAYVREHLEEVNRRLYEKGMREINPNDPRMAQRYGLTSTESDALEEEMEEEAGL